MDVPDEQSSPPPRPRWVKILGIVVLLGVLVLVVIALVTGNHGPSRHGMFITGLADLTHG